MISLSLALINNKTFLNQSPTSLNLKQRRKHACLVNVITPKVVISCMKQQYEEKDNNNNNNNNNNNIGYLTKLALVTLAAGVLTLGPIDTAEAAKSGGRVGGQAFRSSAPRPSSPRINNNNNSRTNIYVNPRVAPPLVGGYGYGVPFYGGWGWSPFSFFAPGPSVAVGVGGGFDTLVLFMVLGAVAAVVRRFFSSRDNEDDYY